MRPKSLSASAVNVYELCPARFAAEIVLRAPSYSGSAANLGTACHKVFELWIVRELYIRFPGPNPDDEALAALRALWDEAYWEGFADRSRYDEGWALCAKWLARQDWLNREVLSSELKQNFVLHTSAGEIPFNYIMDRVDRHADGDIEVVDYKSVSWPVQPDELKVRIQPRAYALAAHLRYPEAKRIWVTFDLLRFDPVGIVFTAAECEDTLRYLHALAERILADNSATENLNPECRWCVRKAECATLQAHVASAGEKLVLGHIDEVVERRAELDFAKKAIEAQITDLDEMIVQYLTAEQLDELDAGRYVARLTSSRRRAVDSEALVELLAYEQFAAIATVGVTGLDALLKSGGVDQETASLIRRTISWRHGARGVSIKRTKA